jgi:hypothetical protein
MRWSSQISTVVIGHPRGRDSGSRSGRRPAGVEVAAERGGAGRPAGSRRGAAGRDDGGAVRRRERTRRPSSAERGLDEAEGGAGGGRGARRRRHVRVERGGRRRRGASPAHRARRPGRRPAGAQGPDGAAQGEEAPPARRRGRARGRRADGRVGGVARDDQRLERPVVQAVGERVGSRRPPPRARRRREDRLLLHGTATALVVQSSCRSRPGRGGCASATAAPPIGTTSRPTWSPRAPL